MDELVDSWKSKYASECQLSLNLTEISDRSKYPNHWFDFISFAKRISPKSILDVGCGCGVFYKLCKKELSGVEYMGIDYSDVAIETAIEQWNANCFYVMNYKDLTREYVAKFDLVHLGGFLCILHDADEAFSFLLSLAPKNVIVGRVNFTQNPSFYKTYMAYDKILTCEYYHNQKTFNGICDKYGYNMEKAGSTILLTKIGNKL